ncbi:hypothetical protein ACH4D5_15255 [Streptomyces sp. NPDC018029]|uniref:hypothetical protein n=1 Tax=Streptomyces sp. NPDC018029 TaxID=3365032 RepID=UPI0037AC78ED
MLTVLVLVGRENEKDLIARIESIPDVCVLSHTDDSTLALARARVLLPDVLVIDLSACLPGDAAAVVHRARGLGLPSELVVHGGDAVVGAVSCDGEPLPARESGPGGLVRTLTRLARRQHAS